MTLKMSVLIRMLLLPLSPASSFIYFFPYQQILCLPVSEILFLYTVQVLLPYNLSHPGASLLGKPIILTQFIAPFPTFRPQQLFHIRVRTDCFLLG